MRKIIYFHIGTHKTGTTSLQHFLYANKNRLQAAGISYPDIGIDEGAQHRLGGSLINGLGFNVFGNKAAKFAHISEIPVWAQLKSHIETIPQSSILVSTEEFEWLTKPGIIREYLGEHDYRIIVYVRRQDSYLESLYQTLVKGHRRLPLPFPLWLNKVLNVWMIHDYMLLLSRWGEVFGKENILVRIFEKEARQGLERGFLEILALPSDVIESCAITTPVWDQLFRESIDARCLEVLRLGNQVKTPLAHHQKLLREMVELSKSLSHAGEANKRLATEQELERIMTSIRDSNATLSRIYFGSDSDIFNADCLSNA